MNHGTQWNRIHYYQQEARMLIGTWEGISHSFQRGFQISSCVTFAGSIILEKYNTVEVRNFLKTFSERIVDHSVICFIWQFQQEIQNISLINFIIFLFILFFKYVLFFGYLGYSGRGLLQPRKAMQCKLYPQTILQHCDILCCAFPSWFQWRSKESCKQYSSICPPPPPLRISVKKSSKIHIWLNILLQVPQHKQVKENRIKN